MAEQEVIPQELPMFMFQTFVFAASTEEKNTYFLVLNTIGKLGVTIGFAVIYFWCGEVFPTLIRSSLMGAGSMFARVGSVFAPLIADMVSEYLVIILMMLYKLRITICSQSGATRTPILKLKTHG